MLKTLAFIQRNDTYFSIGDFYPVLSVFSHHELGTTTSPFLLLDHLGPSILAAKSKKKGVNKHPHRGFETVTLMFSGELQHQDSTGGGGVISAGDVQWMTAGAGVMHKEEFSSEFREKGGYFEMVQLWVNLPAKSKLVSPRYQSIRASQIPVVEDLEQQMSIRVIAGEYQGKTGPAHTYSPIQMLDVTVKQGQSIQLPAQHEHTSLVYLRKGEIQIGDEVLLEQGMAVMSSQGTDIELKVLKDSQILLLNGQPLLEPLIAHGPFVMNSHEEILESYEVFKAGEFLKPE